MPSQPFGQSGDGSLAAELTHLQATLRASLETLKSAKVAPELQAALHDDKNLPDKALARLASDTIDLLSQLEQLLQPAHLVLADHFLGAWCDLE